MRLIDVERTKIMELPALRFASWHAGKQYGWTVILTPGMEKPRRAAQLAGMTARAIWLSVQAAVEGKPPGSHPDAYYDPGAQENVATVDVLAALIRRALT